MLCWCCSRAFACHPPSPPPSATPHTQAPNKSVIKTIVRETGIDRETVIERETATERETAIERETRMQRETAADRQMDQIDR